MHPRQLSLFESVPAVSAAEPAIASDRARAIRSALGDGAWLEHVPGCITGADALFRTLEQAAEWRTEERPMYERIVAVPRLLASYEIGSVPLVERMAALLSARHGVLLDRITMALYRDGQDSVAWHRDRPMRDLPQSVVAVVSLGAPRRFAIRPLGGGASRRIVVRGGDVVVMGGTIQRSWEHSVPKCRDAGPRMSIMFRHAADAVFA